jgi:hypothetical protein
VRSGSGAIESAIVTTWRAATALPATRTPCSRSFTLPASSVAKGYNRRELESGLMRRQELDAFIRFALETLPQRTASTEEARAVLIAEGIITADGELAAEYRSAGNSGKLRFFRPRAFSAGSAT